MVARLAVWADLVSVRTVLLDGMLILVCVVWLARWRLWWREEAAVGSGVAAVPWLRAHFACAAKI